MEDKGAYGSHCHRDGTEEVEQEEEEVDFGEMQHNRQTVATREEGMIEEATCKREELQQQWRQREFGGSQNRNINRE